LYSSPRCLASICRATSVKYTCRCRQETGQRDRGWWGDPGGGGCAKGSCHGGSAAQPLRKSLQARGHIARNTSSQPQQPVPMPPMPPMQASPTIKASPPSAPSPPSKPHLVPHGLLVALGHKVGGALPVACHAGAEGGQLQGRRGRGQNSHAKNWDMYCIMAWC
jgi:hypothetical protein